MKRWGIILLIVAGALVPSGHLLGGQDARGAGGAPGDVARPTANASVVNGSVVNGPGLNGPVPNGPVPNGPVTNGSIHAAAASERSCALEAPDTLADARPQGTSGQARAYCPIDESRQR